MATKHSEHKFSSLLRPFGTEHWMFYLSLLFYAASIVILTVALNSEHQVVVATPAKPFAAGQDITMGSATVSVSHISYAGNAHAFSAPAGKHYLVFDFTVRNNSDKPINVLPTTDTYVKDAAGHVVYLTPYELSNPFRSGELPPGEKVTGQLSYLVPKNTAMTFYVDSIWSGGVLPIAIK